MSRISREICVLAYCYVRGLGAKIAGTFDGTRGKQREYIFLFTTTRHRRHVVPLEFNIRKKGAVRFSFLFVLRSNRDRDRGGNVEARILFFVTMIFYKPSRFGM